MSLLDFKFNLGPGTIEFSATSKNATSIILTDASMVPVVCTVAPISVAGLLDLSAQLTQFIQSINRLEN